MKKKKQNKFPSNLHENRKNKHLVQLHREPDLTTKYRWVSLLFGVGFLLN